MAGPGGAASLSGRLRRSDCRSEGISRSRARRGFVYRDPGGERIDDEETLARIRELAIPPAWKEVWICLDPLGHLQAHRPRRHAARAGAAACAVRLLDLGFFRVGGEAYTEENESFGLATVRREHVSIRGGEVVFDFPAKSGQRRVQSIRDPAVRRAIEAMRRRRGGPDDLLAGGTATRAGARQRVAAAFRGGPQARRQGSRRAGLRSARQHSARSADTEMLSAQCAECACASGIEPLQSL